jgi:abortive infection bacteriophage resistance protein
MKTYKKKPLLYPQQLDLWKNRGLIIEDEEKATIHLSQINYYRLSAYALPFQKVKDFFDADTKFDHLLSLYSFDRELRLLVFDAIERIEIAIRTQMIYTLALKYNDSHWQDNASLFKPATTNQRTGNTSDIYNDTQKIIKKHLDAKHPEVFVKHYQTEYNNPQNPPSWMIMELLTIGELSRLYNALKENADKEKIAQYFGLHHTAFSSWLHTLVYVRNICAHHSRLWNREFAIKPDVLRKPQHPWLSIVFDTNNHRTFYCLSIIKYMLIACNPENHFKQKLIGIIDKYPNTPIKYMGIPSISNRELIKWENEPIWQL